jgi:uncharacterized cupin superfamily protein
MPNVRNRLSRHPRDRILPSREEQRVPVSALVARSGAAEFQAGGIDPAWILAGSPRMRSAGLVLAPDKGSSVNFWDCTAGKFRWQYGWEETVFILEGEMRVTDVSGNSSVLRAGDVAHFPAGTSFVWEVDKYVRKMAFHRRPVVRGLRGFVRRCIRALREKVRFRADRPNVHIW